MIGATELAKQELKRVLNAKTDKAEACLRLKVNDQGKLALAIDIEREGDQALEHEGSKLLLVERDLADTLQGRAELGSFGTCILI